MKSVLVDAAWMAYQGNLYPAYRWLKALGAEVYFYEGALYWRNAPTGVTGAISGASGDPIAAVVQLLLATVGDMWTEVPEANMVYEEIMERWKEETKQRQKAKREAR